MPSHEALESITAQLGTFEGREKRIAVGASSLLEPSLQNFESFLSQRCAALLATLALAADVGSRSGHDIATAQVDEFR